MYNIIEYLERSCEKFPNKIAFADDKRSITYGELLLEAKKIGSFIGANFEKNKPIPIFMEKSVETICLIFGIVYGGCFYVMMDLKQPSSRFHHIMESLGADVIVTSEKYEKSLDKIIGEEKKLYFEDLEKSQIDHNVLQNIQDIHIDTDPLYCIFTSGSTGVPKGVLVSHRSVIDFIYTFVETFEIGEDEIIGNQAPWDFDVSVKDIYSTICVGARMEIIPKQFFSMPAKLLDFLDDRRVSTIIWAVSAVTIISTLKGFEYKVPKNIRKVMFSGEVMPIKQLNIWRKYLPQAKYINLYGPTEITCNCTYHIIDRAYDLGESLPIGKPFKNERVFLLDEEDRLIPKENVGSKGEICISGTALALGYYNNWEQTNRAFCQNPLNDKYIEYIYRTGDLGYYKEDGLLYFSSRKDFQIKHMGHRIELGEVENALDKVDKVKRGICIFEDNKINAFYEGDIDKKALHKELKVNLPMYMLPNRYINVDSFPLNKNGKVDRNRLKEILEERDD